MSFISKKQRMFKIRAKSNKTVKPNLAVFKNCNDSRLWCMNSFERHQGLLDAMIGVQYEGEEDSVSSEELGHVWPEDGSKKKQMVREHAAQIEQYQMINQTLTADNERMMQLLRKCEEEKFELSQINHELNQVRQQLTQQRNSIDIGQSCREKLEKQVKDHDAKIRELKNELHSKENMLRAMEAGMMDLPAVERELENIKRLYNLEQQEVAKLRESKNEYINQLAAMEKELVVLRRESEMLQQVQKEKEEFEKNVKKSLSQGEEDKKILKMQMEANKKTYESERTAWAQKHAQIVEKLKKTQEDLVAKMMNEAKQLRNDLELSEKEREALRKNSESLKQDNEKHVKEIAQQACRIKQLEEKIQTFSDNLIKAQEELKNMASEKEALVKQQKEILSKIQCEHEKELKIIKANEEDQKKITRELDAIKAKLSELTKERDAMKVLADQQTTLANSREKEMKELMKEMKNLEKINASLRESNELLKNNEKEMMQKLKLFQEERTKEQGENLQSRSDSQIQGKANQGGESCKDCMCKVLVESQVQKMGDGGVNIKDVLAKALVEGLQSLRFNEIAQLHQHMQNALGQLVENGRIDLKTGAPVVLSYLHRTDETHKELIRGKVEDVEKVLKCQEKLLKNDVGCLQRGVTATKHRVDRLKEKAQKTSQVIYKK